MSMHSVVIVGGGFAGVTTAQELIARGVAVTLISETNHFTFTPLLHEVATGALISHDATFEYEGFFHSPLFRFVRGRVTGIDREAREVQIGEESVAYEYVVLAPGSTTNFRSMQGTEHMHVLKRIEDAVELKRSIVERAQALGRSTTVTVIGGGPTGLELVFEIDRMLKALFKRGDGGTYVVRLIHSSEIFCQGAGDKVQAYIGRALERAGIELVCNAYAESVTENQVFTTVGTFASDITVLCAGVRPHTEFLRSQFALDERGHLPVSDALQSVEDERVFALGDVIALESGIPPKLAQTAVAQAPIVAENIHRLRKIEAARLKTYTPRVKGMLFSLGYGDGVGTIGPVVVKGVLAWYLWRTVYLFKTPGLWNKLRVAFSWTMDLFQGRNLTEI